MSTPFILYIYIYIMNHISFSLFIKKEQTAIAEQLLLDSIQSVHQSERSKSLQDISDTFSARSDCQSVIDDHRNFPTEIFPEMSECSYM